MTPAGSPDPDLERPPTGGGGRHRTPRAGDPGLLGPEVRSVCIVLLTGIGDVVHGLPVANALRDRRPDLRVCWVAEPAPSRVVEHHPSVDRIVVFRKGEGVRGVLRLRRELRDAGPFDLTLNAQRYFKSVFPTLLSGARIRLGLPRDKTRDGVSLVNTHHLPGGPWKHTQELFLDFLGPLGVSRPDPPEWRITFSEDEERAAADFEDAHPDGPRVGLVTGTANPEKDWPPERYPPLADALAREGASVFLLGGPGARERSTARRTLEESRSDPTWALTDSVRTLMWRLRAMDLVVSPDTGPVHIAHALGVPVVGLYGHTNPWRVGPFLHSRELVVDRYTEPGAEPDPAGYEPKDGRMEAITVDDVLDRVRKAGTVPS